MDLLFTFSPFISTGILVSTLPYVIRWQSRRHSRRFSESIVLPSELLKAARKISKEMEDWPLQSTFPLSLSLAHHTLCFSWSHTCWQFNGRLSPFLTVFTRSWPWKGGVISSEPWIIASIGTCVWFGLVVYTNVKIPCECDDVFIIHSVNPYMTESSVAGTCSFASDSLWFPRGNCSSEMDRFPAVATERSRSIIGNV